MNNELVARVVAVADPYLGAGADRFVARQITSHLNTTIEQFDASKLDELAGWVELSASLLIDKTKAKELADEVRKLA
jgi:hypothetical protein